MSVRIICDYCKNSFDQSKLSKVGFVEKNFRQKPELIFDLCDECKKILVSQLAADPKPIKERPRPKRVTKQDDDTPTGDIVHDLEEGLIDPDKDEGKKTKTKKRKVTGTSDPKECPHMNKTRVTVPKDGSRPYRICRDCKTKIPFKKPEVDEKTPAGVRVKGD